MNSGALFLEYFINIRSSFRVVFIIKRDWGEGLIYMSGVWVRFVLVFGGEGEGFLGLDLDRRV